MTGIHEAAMAADGDWERHLVILRHIVRGRWDPVQAMELQRHGDDDSFCHFVIGQHLTHFVVGRSAVHQAPLLPQRWMETLRGQVLRWQEARTRLKEHLAAAAGALSTAGLDYRVLKGIPFAQKYLGDVSQRRSADIDLLVHEVDVDRALAVLGGLGYRAATPHVRMTPQGPVLDRAVLRGEHELNLEHDGIQIDLHWRFRTAPAYRWRDSEIWARTDDVCVEGMNYPVLPDEYALVLLLVSTAHDIARGGCRLKHLLDVHQLLQWMDSHVDWAKFLECRRAENTLRISVNMLAMVLDIWADDLEFPRLREVLSLYADLQAAGAGKTRAIELLRSPRGGVDNKVWFARVYGVRWRRDAAWMVVRSMPHPRRWPAALSRIIRFGGERTWHVARTFLAGERTEPSPERGKPPANDTKK